MDSILACRRRMRRALRAGLLAAFAVIAPAADAAAQTAADSTATLLWTAPGDDGDVGRAARYEMRYRSSTIVGTDTLSWWNAAAVVPNMPTPSAAGATDSVVVRGLDPVRSYYFILRSADEVPNWSGFSNVAVKPPYVDAIRPAAITDLGVGSSTTSTAEPARSRPGTPPRR